MRTPRRSRVVLLSTTVALALGAGGVSTSAASPAGTDPTDSAWIVVRDPLDPSGVPAAKDRGNSTGGSATWVRNLVGDYTVVFEGLDDAGVPQVTALSTSPRICIVLGWGSSPVGITVWCTNRQGEARDTPFALTYTRGTSGSGGVPGRLAHAWVDADTPNSYYNHVTNGGQITRVVNGPGDYRLIIPGLGSSVAGTVQLTPYQHAGACSTKYWDTDSGNIRVDVLCRNLDGDPSDAMLDLLFLRKLGPEGFGGGPAAYVFAYGKNRSAPYRPDTTFSWQSNGKRPTIDRTGVGVYKVTLKDMPRGGAATVTTYTAGKERCQLGRISTTAPATIVIRCYKPNGDLVNSDFTLAWTK